QPVPGAGWLGRSRGVRRGVRSRAALRVAAAPARTGRRHRRARHSSQPGPHPDAVRADTSWRRRVSYRRTAQRVPGRDAHRGRRHTRRRVPERTPTTEGAVMTDPTTTEILELGRRWAQAEQHADVETLDALAVADFELVGPLGFVLDKQQWLDRYRTGDLT